MSVFTDIITLTKMECSCGGVFAISETYRAEAQKLGGFKKCWHCPYCGTSRGYGKGTIDNLKEELAQKEAALARQHTRNDELRRERDHHWTERKKLRTRYSNMKTRIAHGVCPCCNRHFENIARHMETKHPHYKNQETRL